MVCVAMTARSSSIDNGMRCRPTSNDPACLHPDPFNAHWAQVLQCLGAKPDQTALELLMEFRARYPEGYSARQLRKLQRRLKVWRREAVQRLICEIQNLTQNVTATACGFASPTCSLA